MVVLLLSVVVWDYVVQPGGEDAGLAACFRGFTGDGVVNCKDTAEFAQHLDQTARA